MPIYSKPVRLLMKDFVADLGIVKGQIFIRDQVNSWFMTHYPKIKEGTISAHLTMMSTNAPSRIHYNVNPVGEDDLFFQIGGSQFRLYDADNDPAPIYGNTQAQTVVKPRFKEFDIEKNIHEYIYGDMNTQGIKPLERYASFDYCFNYFQLFREQKRLNELVSPNHVQESCLHLGFYLASWGMLRGSTFLQSKSVKVYESLIGAIVGANPALWDIDVDCYTSVNIQLILDFSNAIAQTLDYRNGPSDILITKILLGVFGNVPAFDSYFKKGFGVSTFGKHALEKVANFYQMNDSVINKNRLATLDFLTGKPTHRLYTRAKVIDMIFFIEGGKAE